MSLFGRNYRLGLLWLMLLPCVANSSPWIGTVNPQLHNDLQTLTEWGYIDAVTTSFPVPWKGIAAQLERLDSSEMPAPAEMALQRLRHYMQQFKHQQRRTFVSFYGATDESRFTSFYSSISSKAQLNISTEFYSDRWAANLSVNSLPGGEKNLDRSFVAYQFGDWNVRLGSIDQWWGPATSSSLIVSTNARPIPAIALSRASADRSDSPWLRFLGPWYFTSQVGQLERDRYIADAKLVMSRFNFKPVDGLELGLSWLTMWGGKGQGNGLSDLVDALSFSDECNAQATECDGFKGNHESAFDLKYSFKLAGLPVSVYGQILAETRAANDASLAGIATYIDGYRLYLEGSDTKIECNSLGAANCVYEDSVYKSGLRFHQRAIGSTYDSDAEVVTAGVTKHYANGDVMQLALTHLRLNADKEQPSPVVIGDSEKQIQVSGFYQKNWGQWQFKLGGQVARSELDSGDNSVQKLLYTQIKYVIE